MTIATDLLASILSNPDDDTPRLVYADWLEERGQLARARLIRAQCDAARAPAWSRRAAEARFEADALVARWGGAWRAELPALEGVEWGDFDRGFVSTVRVRDTRALVAHAAAIAAATPAFRVELRGVNERRAFEPARVPWLRVLRLDFEGQVEFDFHARRSILSAARELEVFNLGQYGDTAWLDRRARGAPLERFEMRGTLVAGRALGDQLVERAAPEHLRRLGLGTQFVDFDTGYFEDPTLRVEGARRLAAARFDRLEALNLDRQRVASEGLALLLDGMPRLRELELRRNELTDVTCLARSAGAPLARLGLGYNAIGDAGVEAIAQAPRLTALESLELETCEITAAGLAKLVASPAWHTLRVLDLGRNPLGVEGARVLADAPAPEHLHTLVLDDVDFAADAGAVLARAPWLRRLAVLDLSGNELATAAALFDRLAEGSLRELSLRKTGLSATTAPALRPLWGRLARLDLGDNALGDDGLEALISDAPSPLVALELAACSIGERGAQTLARAPLPRLCRLGLARSAPGSSGLRALVASPLFESLADLDLSGHVLSDEDVLFLASSPAIAHFSRLDLRNDEGLSEALCLALAASEPLRGVRGLRLYASAWSFLDSSRAALTARFGPGWWRHEDGEADAVEHPYQ